MNSIPALIRALNRIIFSLSLDQNRMVLDFTNAPDFPVLFERLFQVLINENLLLKVSGVRSTFGSAIIIKPQVQVVETEACWPVPNMLLQALGEHIGIKPSAPVNLYLGYLGRTLEKDGGRLITDGLAAGENDKIYLDLAAHMVYPLDTTGWRITHELLHTFGLREEEERGVDWQVYLQHKNLIDEYAQKVKHQIPTQKAKVDMRCKQVEMQHADMIQALWEICDSLATHGLILLGRDLCFAKTFVPVFPAGGNPPFDIVEFDIPFA